MKTIRKPFHKHTDERIRCLPQYFWKLINYGGTL